MLTGITGLGLCLLAAAGGVQGGVEAKAPHELARPTVTLRPEGVMGRYVKNIVAQWLLTAPEANPGMVEMMRLRDRKPPMRIRCPGRASSSAST